MSIGEELHEEYRRHRDHLFGYALALTRDPQVAEEIFQTFGLAVAEEARRGAEIERFPEWAREVIRRRAAEHYRGRARVRARERPLDSLIDRAFVEYEPPSEGSEARHAALRECLKRLEGRRREFILGRYEAGKSVREMASASGWTEEAVKVALWKSRRALFECVESRLKVLSHDV